MDDAVKFWNFYDTKKEKTYKNETTLTNFWNVRYAIQ